MTSPSSPCLAPGGPGIEPRRTRGAKVAVGTAYSTSSNVWYTLDCGCITEVYYPTIDSSQIRDLQFLITDGETFFHDERRKHMACDGSAIQFVRVPTTRAIGLIFLLRGAMNRRSNIRVQLGQPFE